MRNILTFGTIAIAALFALQGIRLLKGSPISANFTRAFGLIVIATLGTALALASIPDTSDKSAAFTLLGTVAGYLVGAKAGTTSETGGRPEEEQTLQ